MAGRSPNPHPVETSLMVLIETRGCDNEIRVKQRVATRAVMAGVTAKIREHRGWPKVTDWKTNRAGNDPRFAMKYLAAIPSDQPATLQVGTIELR